MPYSENDWRTYLEAQNGDILHYGVSKRDGAARGSGRYPLGSGARPRSYQNLLNAYDRQRAHPVYDAAKAIRQASKYVSKIEKAEAKGKDTAKLEFKKKQAIETAKLKADEIKKIDANIEKTIKLAKESGYTVQSKNVMRSAAHGKDLALAVVEGFGTLALTAVLPTPFLMTAYSVPQVKGEKYSVSLNERRGLVTKYKKY